MTESIEADLCVIGAGSGGLTVAAGASQMGARVVLIERAAMGGDCLNYGCVPSKSLIAAAGMAATVRAAAGYGVDAQINHIDMAKVHHHVHRVMASIAPHDSVERFEGLGVRVIQETGHFIDAKTVQAGSYIIKARRFVIATGSQPMVPPIPGLEQVSYFTNETLFDNQLPLPHLLVLGAGPIGVEMAAAYARLGSQVTIIDRERLLFRADAECTAIVQNILQQEGVNVIAPALVKKVAAKDKAIELTVEANGQTSTIIGSHLLVAVGRTPNMAALNLEAAGIDYTARGVTVDSRLRTRNKRVFAIGDVIGRFPFTHMAGYQGGIVIKNILFRLPAKIDERVVPWVVYTDPEIAQVGMTEAEAQTKGLWVETLKSPFSDNDRARAEGKTDGLVKVVLGKSGAILGVSMVGWHAGELLQPWILAMQQKLPISALATMIAPYPTWGEINKRVAGSYYTPRLYSEKTKRLVRFLARWD